MQKSRSPRKGFSRKVVEEISELKREPSWMRELRLSALEVFKSAKLPKWGPIDRLAELDFNEMYYFVRPVEDSEGAAKSWDDVPDEIREKYDKLGIPEGEKEYLAGLGAQFESEMVYHTMRADLAKMGIIFEDMSEAVRNHPDLVKKHFGKLVSPGNNKLAALNSAMWSGGSFTYIPPGVSLAVPLHNFFQMSRPSLGQFERTLIVAEEGSSFEFLEGCVAPLYSEVSLHAGVVEIFVKKGAKVKYSTMQNWSKNVFNLVTKASRVEEEGSVEWSDGNVGSGVTMKYPSMILAGPKAKGRLLSLTFAGKGQVIDSGAKVFHQAPETMAQVESKSILRSGGRSSFRGRVFAGEKAENAKSSVECVAMHLEKSCRSDTYPDIQLENATAAVEHESSILGIGEDQLKYLMSRGIREEEARGMVISGFVEPFTTALPMEYAVEFNRLIDLEVRNGIG